ncbi:cell division protein ZapE [Candidatus Pantoea edessiphila]|uniref:Cell division protein ZapE n=1 Tax=Candidatus Pantoea edessiphila TaxID=2044610 RepID=A0A2P5SYC0_9GAMM|nr:cell division protein ZapE [Candidatus Pantoea edessiphila]MBK4775656.1 cell division protein ZapE [Pantoea sp. Edef]PPI87302.1 cell division protein ZapE [Candidatus Pantoea edessiphila]
MKNLSLILLYKKAILLNQFKFDEVQYKTITILNRFYKTLFDNQRVKYFNFKKFLKILIRLTKKNREEIKLTTRGVYLWGEPGCGKTWIASLFFSSISSNRKIHFHFCRFILYVREKMKVLQGHNNPLLIIAHQLKFKIDILFIDEFYISDNSDAIIINTLIQELLKREVILIITSNINIEKLNLKCLENSIWLITIENIQKYFKIINMNSGIDYRTRHIKSICLWKCPLNEKSCNYMEKMFNILSGNKLKNSMIRINYRDIVVLGNSNGVLSIDFQSICGDGRSHHDYMKLSRIFHSILIHNIPIMKYHNENEAKRFLLLIDELYVNNIKLIVSAETDKLNIYQGTHLKFEYKRCLSRLEEMQSENYFQSPN